MAKTMRRKYICTNGVVEVTQFTVGDKTEATGKKWRRAKSQDDKRDENARQAVRVAARILNCNYTQEDYLVELTYSDESVERLFEAARSDPSAAHGGTSPEVNCPERAREAGLGHCAGEAMGMEERWEAAREILSRKLEQVRRAAKKAGVEVKTFAVTSDLDQETGELVRVHHHVVISVEGLELLKKKWTYGMVLEKHLYRQDDYTPLAAYLLGQVRHKENRKKYSCSRNMVQPKVEEMVLAEDPGNEIRVQPGAKVLDRTPYREGFVSQYVRYKRKPATRKRGGHKVGGASNDPSGGNAAISPCAGEPLGAVMSGGSKFREDMTAEGGSGHEFSKIAWR